jgi:oligopeptide/dipeptide ABC transporter ATP-binding protein
VLDEPVSALDVSISAQILNLLKDLQDELGIGYLLITHDLATAVYLSHRIEIIYAGKVVESIISTNLVKDALHPYTKSLLKAASLSKMRKGAKDLILQGEVPDPLRKPPGCHFHPRCSSITAKCRIEEPIIQAVGIDHSVRCHLYS